MSEENKKETLNKEAKEFIPTKNRIPEKLNLNKDAKEYVPKPKVKVEYVEGDDDDEEKYITVTLIHRNEVDITGAGKTEEEVDAEINTALPDFDINGITGWRLPTEAEANALSIMNVFNKDVVAQGGTVMNTDYYYYKENNHLLCFFRNATSTVTGRQYTSGQHLRPVTTLKFRKQQE